MYTINDDQTNRFKNIKINDDLMSAISNILCMITKMILLFDDENESVFGTGKHSIFSLLHTHTHTYTWCALLNSQ